MSQILEGQNRYTLSDSRRREQEAAEKQPAKFLCAFCKWSFTGPVVKGREKAQAHREKRHPETFLLPRRRRRGKSLSTFRYASMDEESIKEVEDERKKRAFLNGVELG